MEIQRYTRPAITLHWLIAILIITNVALSFIWDAVPKEQVGQYIGPHKALGLLVLGLAVLRLLWRIGHKPPAMPTGFQAWEIRLAGITHVMLYLIMFIMPISGWVFVSAGEFALKGPMTFFGLFELPYLEFIKNMDPVTKHSIHEVGEGIHGVVAKLLYLFLAMHVLGALKHQFIDRKAELQRMWPR